MLRLNLLPLQDIVLHNVKIYVKDSYREIFTILNVLNLKFSVSSIESLQQLCYNLGLYRVYRGPPAQSWMLYIWYRMLWDQFLSHLQLVTKCTLLGYISAVYQCPYCDMHLLSFLHLLIKKPALPFSSLCFECHHNLLK